MPGFPLNNNLSGNVVDLCPVGALGDKDFLYKQRVWFMRRHRGVCTGCSTGCSIWIEENQDRIYRIKPRENPFVNKWWICNFGRYDYPHVHDPRRLTQPAIAHVSLIAERPAQHGSGQEASLILGNDSRTGRARLEHVCRSELLDSLRNAGRLAAVISPHLTVEEAYLLCKFVRGIDAEAILVLGPVPTVGEDERFPGGFTIRAEKCPNRRGVEAVLAHFARRVTTFDDFLPRIGSRRRCRAFGCRADTRPIGSTSRRRRGSSG